MKAFFKILLKAIIVFFLLLLLVIVSCNPENTRDDDEGAKKYSAKLLATAFPTIAEITTDVRAANYFEYFTMDHEFELNAEVHLTNDQVISFMEAAAVIEENYKEEQANRNEHMKRLGNNTFFEPFDKFFDDYCNPKPKSVFCGFKMDSEQEYFYIKATPKDDHAWILYPVGSDAFWFYYRGQ